MSSEGLIIFDMDGVLIDVSRSYREAVRQAAMLFLSKARSSDALPDPLFSLKDLAAVKQSGGLNNDWDLTRLVCSLLFSKLRVHRISQAPDAWQRYTATLSQCDAEPLIHYQRSHGSVLEALLSENNHINAFVDGLYRGDVGSGNVIKQIFQELYLGSPLFEKRYGLPARMYAGNGLVHRESLIIGKKILQRLGQRHFLAIATGRPAAEALIPLQRYGLESLFRLVYTLDDCLSEERKIFEGSGQTVILSKPSPFMLDSIVEKLDVRPSRLYYVGDMPDDIETAVASSYGFIGVGFLAASPDRGKLQADLQRAGADVIVATASELEHYFSDGNK